MKRYRTIVADPPWPYPEGFAKNNGGCISDGTSNCARRGTAAIISKHGQRNTRNT